MTEPGRYPIQPLADAMGLSVNKMCLQLGVSGSTLQQYRSRGVTDYVAESLAHKAGLHVFEVWPEMLDARIEELPKCDECKGSYVRRVKQQRFCSERCRQRWHGRRSQAKWQRTPSGRNYINARSAAYYRENREYVKARERARYARQQERALQGGSGAVPDGVATETTGVFPLVDHSPHLGAFGEPLEGSA